MHLVAVIAILEMKQFPLKWNIDWETEFGIHIDEN